MEYTKNIESNHIWVKKEFSLPEVFVQESNLENDDCNSNTSIETDMFVKEEIMGVESPVICGHYNQSSDQSTEDHGTERSKDTSPVPPIDNDTIDDGVINTNVTDPLMEDPDEFSLSCSICSRAFISIPDLQVHVSTHFQGNEFQCNVCGRKLLNKRTLTSHMKLHLERLVSCSQCDKKFHHKKDVIRHSRVHTGEKPFPCTICNKHFHDKSTLNCHVRVHTGEKPFKCDVCSKSFSQKATLRCHYRLHTDERPYQCAICEKKFHDSAMLKRHSRAHTGEKPFQCGICKKFFYDKSTLNCHIRVHTGIKPFQCHICTRNFSQRVSLRSHLRLHNEIKPYECGVCKKNFHDTPTLKRHSRVHTGEKPFQCATCLKSFTQKVNLRNHMKLHWGAHSQQPLNNDTPLCQTERTETMSDQVRHTEAPPHQEEHPKTVPYQAYNTEMMLPNKERHISTIPYQVEQAETSHQASRLETSSYQVRLAEMPSYEARLTEKPQNQSLYKDSTSINPLLRPSKSTQSLFNGSVSFKSLLRETLPYHERHKETSSSQALQLQKQPYQARHSASQLLQLQAQLHQERNIESSSYQPRHAGTSSYPELYKASGLFQSLLTDTSPYHERYTETTPHLMRQTGPSSYGPMRAGTSPFQAEMQSSKCVVCNERFSDRAALICHLKTHIPKLAPLQSHLSDKPDNTEPGYDVGMDTNGKLHQCFVCNEDIPDYPTWMWHIKAHAGGIRAPTSYMLSSNSVKREESDNNTRSDTEEHIPLQCDVCKAEFTDKSLLINHLNTHKRETPVVISSISCDNPKQLDVKNTPSPEEESIQCDVYAETNLLIQSSNHTSEEIMLNGQQLRSSPEDLCEGTCQEIFKPQLYECDTCKETFTDKSTLLAHLKMQHPENHENDECTVDSEPKSPNIKVHIAGTSPRLADERLCQVDTGNESFTEKSTSLLHVNKHNPETQVQSDICSEPPPEDLSECATIEPLLHEPLCQCNECEKTNCNSATHIENKSEFISSVKVEPDNLTVNTEESPYVCGICTRTFSDETTLDSHVREHMGELARTSDDGIEDNTDNDMSVNDGQKPYECNVCLKSFAKESVLITHLKIHKKKFQCDLCPESFTLRSKYQNHYHLHTGRKPFQCLFCRKTFARSGYLAKHIKRHKEAMVTLPVVPTTSTKSDVLSINMSHSIFG